MVEGGLRSIANILRLLAYQLDCVFVHAYMCVLQTYTVCVCVCVCVCMFTQQCVSSHAKLDTYAHLTSDFKLAAHDHETGSKTVKHASPLT